MVVCWLRLVLNVLSGFGRYGRCGRISVLEPVVVFEKAG